MRGALLLLGIAAGCYQPSPATGRPCAENGACPEGLACIAGTCELPGTGDAAMADTAMADAAIDACPAATCSGNDIVGCGAPVTCANGCSEVGGAHCMQLVPSNGVMTSLLVGATANVGGGENWHFHPYDGEIHRGNQTLRAPGTGVIAGIRFEIIDGMGVFAANSFTSATTDNWSADGPNPLVLFAATTITVRGDIDVGASGSTGGPGGSDATGSMSGTGCRGRAGRFFSAGFGEGGGGGGGRTAGANGGNSNQGASAGLGGTSCTAAPTTLPLRGGAGGGHGGDSINNAGGGGGGALALIAMDSIVVTGDVGAPGEGGNAGTPGTAPTGDGGGGGGGGGAVLLEAPRVTVSGALTANGGGGAAPTTGDGNRGYLGSSTAASGGSFTGPGGTRSGGTGGTGTVSPTVGSTYIQDDALVPPTVIITRGAGGGGAAGRTEIKSLMRTTTGATLSPAPTLSSATVQ